MRSTCKSRFAAMHLSRGRPAATLSAPALFGGVVLSLRRVDMLWCLRRLERIDVKLEPAKRTYPCRSGTGRWVRGQGRRACGTSPRYPCRAARVSAPQRMSQCQSGRVLWYKFLSCKFFAKKQNPCYTFASRRIEPAPRQAPDEEKEERDF